MHSRTLSVQWPDGKIHYFYVKVTHAALAEKKDPKEKISKSLFNYRNTPHLSTKKKPSELMMNCTVRTELPALIRPPKDE